MGGSMQGQKAKKSALSRMLSKETIALGLGVRDWQEAVRAAGSLLVRK